MPGIRVESMTDPSVLYNITGELGNIPEGLDLVVGLTGFTDAGGAVGQIGDYILDNLSNRVIAEFDADELLDYRARRPIIYFDQDHLSDYQPPALRLYLVQDELNQPFLFLNGFEPDFRWEGFAASVVELIGRLSVKTTTSVHAIPMPVPHTRPIRVTVSGNRLELIDALSVWKPHTQVPANAMHLVEFRLQELGHPVAGFALLVPHYLADTEFPLPRWLASRASAQRQASSFPPTSCEKRAGCSSPRSRNRSEPMAISKSSSERSRNVMTPTCRVPR